MWNIDYMYYLISVFIITGFLTLTMDLKIYKMAKIKKEQKATIVLGFMNVVTGFVLLVIWLLYQNWFMWI
ncbi:hypothetical protein AJ85_03505 [Alkalihalobacillus alcalophilus ATCC 27647 = CGMCC 1.3604]|uniref:Uncharacterized protein n=1 Tax=Alkalihalobacillus alcalophilus ATCC 27647 = CGMCC 1.3604 TaxID=1218173 RepID=A0A094YZB6_ALKAL|nr:CLC_0170 family protein [Alkalihalobacillus alcalophilus]KGA98897.1 hypothetical protein BALCAV_0202135 [Alkalihalobacillus alcalophilus ATCC 27647 = CGMCC 1.3604]MED1560536.1 hypothetical protein [Alkalihalobacillus alcalophilus]THG91657.1 hypothetical protein AJ85_03505 [Alkalihalobacillus alcalophilus ATCC 27647 = CGMCC 1.3604]